MMLSIRQAMVGIAALSCGLSGCGLDRHPSYSAGVKYGVRNDPIIHKITDMGDERYDPDRPGVLPIMRLHDAYQPDHPYNAGFRVAMATTLKRIADEESKIDLDKLEAPQRRAAEDRIFQTWSKHQVPFAFALNKFLIDPTLISKDDRKAIEDVLEAAFGTPRAPKVSVADVGGDADEKAALEKVVADLKLDEKTLSEGSKRYRIHCLHCHGVPGDGRGPTARWINPHPRDFRAGLFKFQSVDQTSDKGSARPPSRNDLMRTLRHGIEGTAMPSFNLLADDELEVIISYVIHLSIRGKTELSVIYDSYEFADEDKVKVFRKSEGANFKAVAKKSAIDFTKGWAESNKPASTIMVKEMKFEPDNMAALAASVERGRQIFTATASDSLIDDLTDRMVGGAKKPAVDRAIKEREDKEIKAKAKEIEEVQKKAVKEAKDKGDIAKAAKEIQANDKNKGAKEAEEEAEFYVERAAGEKATSAILAALQKEHAAIEAEVVKGLRGNVRETAKNKLNAPKCVTCHVDFGRQAKFKFDEWGTFVRPNNLTLGVLRGGRRPVDIYYRVHSGITGSVMTPFAKDFAGNEQYLWDLVNFVTVVPYPNMRNQLKLRID